jgi:hypothetical protein
LRSLVVFRSHAWMNGWIGDSGVVQISESACWVSGRPIGPWMSGWRLGLLKKINKITKTLSPTDSHTHRCPSNCEGT